MSEQQLKACEIRLTVPEVAEVDGPSDQLDSNPAEEVEPVVTSLPKSSGVVAASRPARHARQGEARAWLGSFLATFETADNTDDCVLWPFSTNGGAGGRYPQIRIDGRTVRVTRYIFELISGRPLVPREVIRHSCDQPRCINPWHFEVGTQADNMRDMVARRRSAAGERNGSARLTESDVRDIRQLDAEGSFRYGDVSLIARRYDVSPRTIKLILNGETWKVVESTHSRCDTLELDRLSPARRVA